ncbi:MAG: cytochrome P450 [Pseudomonadota bacterium]|nr:cytochrome P450 [Pseudomonadota bacterium]
MNSHITARAAPLRAHPVDPDHFLLGNLKPFAADILGYLEQVSQISSFTSMRFLRTPVYFITDAGLVNEVLSNKSQAFVRNRSFARRLRRLFGKGLLTSEGDEWKTLRRLSAPAFQPKSTHTYIPIILDELEILMNEWQGRDRVNISKAMSRITARVITRCVFGMHLEMNSADMERCMDNLMAALAPRLRFPIYTPDWLPVGGNAAYRRAVQQLDQLIYTNIQRKHLEALHPQPSLLTDLVQASQQHGLIDDTHLRDQIVTLFLAGHETTASTLTFCFILLAQHPHIAQRVQDEVLRVDLARLDSLAAIRESLPQTYRVVQETLRLYPAGYVFGRTVVQDVELGAEAIKSKSLVLISPYISHRNAEVFPEPHRFNPDRWQNLEVPRSQYLPFSAGARTCIGEHLAMLEACLILAGVCARFQVQCGTEKIKVQPAITLRPVNNTDATLQPLQSAEAAIPPSHSSPDSGADPHRYP